MGNVPEAPVYDDGVYEFVVTDPVQGGRGGVANSPTTNLANRTAWLKQRLDALTNGSLIPPTVAPLNGPAFTGSSTAPNVTPGDDSTLIANTDFVQTAKHGLVVVPVGGNINVTLTQPQWGVGILIFTGVLTGNIAVIFPSGRPGAWIVQNATTGPFSLICQTAAGSGVVVPQTAPFDAIWCDGADVHPQVSPFLLALSNPMIIAALGFTPVQQGGGSNQLTNKVYIGWSAAGRLRLQVDVSDLGNFALEGTTNTFSSGQRAANNTWWSGLTTGAGVQPLIGVDSSNDVTLWAGPAGTAAWRVVNSSASSNLLTLDPTGNLVALANILAKGRLRANVGSVSSADPQAATILSDFLATTNNGTDTWFTIPALGLGLLDNLIVQVGEIIVPGTAVNTIYNLPRAFPVNFAAIIISFGSNVPPNTGAIGAQPANLSQFTATNTSGGAQSNGCFFIAVGW